MNTGAQTRFNNDRQDAAQASLQGQVSPLARQSVVGAVPNMGNLRRKGSLPGNLLGGLNNRPNPNALRQQDLQSTVVGLAQQPNTLNLPDIFNQDLKQYAAPEEDVQFNLDSLVNNIELDKFFNSPKLSEAIARSKLTEFFKTQYGGV